MKHNILNVIPDVRHVIPHLMRNLLPLLAAAAILGACTEDYIAQPVGTLPDEGPMLATSGKLVSTKSLAGKRSIRLYEGDDPAVEQVVYQLTKPASKDITVKVVPSEELAQAYIDSHPIDDWRDPFGGIIKIEMNVLPKANLIVPEGGSVTVPAGKKTSNPLDLTVSSEGLEDGLYMFAVTLDVSEGQENANLQNVIYYCVEYHKKVDTCNPEYKPVEFPPFLDGLFTICYVNTSVWTPRIVSKWGIWVDFWQYFSFGNVLNLRSSTIGYDSNKGRASLKLNSDLSYVLEHRHKYLRDVQILNRKVCLCIQNGGEGIGFCNMSDAQISDFVMQVKTVIDKYGLDGVNLWDEDSKYPGGVPDNTTSYPKLIKALREAMPDKMITLVDKGEATEYFYDETQCGGIRVGEFLDYAWHGYATREEGVQIINPNLEGTPQPYSNYNRKPIAGLPEEKYGSVTIPLYQDYQEEPESFNNIASWKLEGLRKSDVLVWQDDIIGTSYGGYETVMNIALDTPIMNFIDDGTFSVFYMGVWLDPQMGGRCYPAGVGDKDW